MPDPLFPTPGARFFAPPEAPAPPKPPGRKPRAFGDAAATRSNVFDAVLEAASAVEPVSNQRHTLRLTNVVYADPDRVTKAEHKRAILEGRTLGRRLKGTWELLDNATGAVVDRRHQVVARVPYLTDLGTFVHGGSDYTVNHQQRLKPGVFGRVKANGEVESHVNVLPGKGFSHRYMFDPDKGTFHLTLGQARLPLTPLLRAAGVTDDQMKDAWGPEVFASNYGSDDPSALRKLAQKVLRPKDLESGGDHRAMLAERFASMELDPFVNGRTLGKPHKGLTADAMLDATRKLLSLYKGESEPDDRDHLAYQRVVGPEDLFAERVTKDHSKVRRALLHRASFRGNLGSVPAGALTPQIEQAILGSGLGQALEEVNPGEVLDRQTLVTRMGEGGLSSPDVIPDDSRAVQPSHLGFIDPLRTPESLRAGVDTYMARGARKNPDGSLSTAFRDARTGEEVYKTPEEVADAVVAFPGSLKLPYRRVPVMKNGRIGWELKEKVDYEVPRFEDAFSPLANLVPFKSAAKGQRVAMGSRMLTQALPLVEPEAPHVRAGVPGSGGRSFEEEYGPHFGALRSEHGGVVKEVGGGRVVVRADDGRDVEHELYENHPFNRKTGLTQTPVVRPGDRVEPGRLLARSNFTDDAGHAAIGRNARVAFMPWGGKNYEDAFVVSEGFAKKFTSEHMYQHDLALDDRTRVGKKHYMGLFAGKHEKRHVDAIGDDGVIRPGETVEYGQPLILGVRERDRAHNKVHKPGQGGYADVAVTWDHHAPGVVTDVARGKDGPVVVVKSQSTMQVGDKMCYDDATEVLTSAGWRPIADVTCEDRVASLRPDGVIEYVRPSATHRYEHSGRMYRLETTQVSLRVTDNHRLYARPRGRDGYALIEARELYGKRYRMRRDGVWHGRTPAHVELPGVEVRAGQGGRTTRQLPPKRVPSGTYAMLLGMFLSEGNVIAHPASGSFGFDITQLKAASRAGMLRALDEAGVKYSSCGERGGKVRVYGIHWLRHLAPLGKCHEKYIPNEVFGWGVGALRVLYRWLMWGDGSTTGTAHSYTTTSRRLADDVQRLALHIGYSANVVETPGGPATVCGKVCVARTRYDVYVYRCKNRPEINHGHVKAQGGQSEGWEDYTGQVYCVTLPRNHVLYVRRNGKPVWCGNSNRFGGKGVVAEVVPDHLMPHDRGGQPFDVLANPLGVISRTNPVQLVEMALSKVAARTGKPYAVDDFDAVEDATEFARSELARHGLEDTEPVYDPGTGRVINPPHYEVDAATGKRVRRGSGVLTGGQFLMKLHHQAEGKEQARSSGAYSADEAPAKGGKTGCFAPKQKVLTINGFMPISRVCEKRLGVNVRTFDEGRGEWVYRPVVDWFVYRAKTADMVCVDVVGPCETDGDGLAHGHNKATVSATKNHEFLLYDGTRKLAGELRAGDDLVTWGPVPTGDQWAFLYGTMLGDASTVDANSNFRVEHSVKQAAYVDWKRGVLAGLCPNTFDVNTPYSDSDDPVFSRLNGRRRSSRVLYIGQPHVHRSVRADCYPDGAKRLTPAWLSRLNGLSVAVWVLDDGSITNRAKKAGRVNLTGNIATQGFTPDDRQTLADWLTARYGAPATVNVVGALSLSAELCRCLIDEVARWVPWEAIPRSKMFLRARVAAIQVERPVAPLATSCRLGKVPMPVVAVRPYKHDKPDVAEINVYDFTVADTHTYCAGPALVSNSKRISLIDSNALLSHGVTQVLRDASAIRGQKNEDYWLQFMQGHNPRAPKVPLVYEKFLGQLRAAGVNVVREGTQLHTYALTRPDVDALAGDREVTSGDTVEFDKDLKPVPGGLFDPGATGGHGGRKWSSVRLHEPMLNPVMEEPARRLLGLTQKQLEGVISGTHALPQGTGPAAVAKALGDLNVTRELALTRAKAKGGTRSERDDAVRKLGYLKALKARDLSPADWVLDRVPVLPPAFRPVSLMGSSGVPLVSDSNWLYKELIEANDNLKAMRAEVGDANVGAERLAVYHAFKAVTGLGDPVGAKTQEKQVKGILRQVFASSPKLGTVQRKLIGSTVDNVGRGVVVPNPSMDMDHIGLPEDMAFPVYEKFVVRRLVRKGMKVGQALQEVRDRTERARRELVDEMGHRPVIVNRAPVLHKFGILAHRPVLVAGHALHVSPMVVKGYGMDFDGDAVQFHVPTDEAARQEALDRMLPSRALLSPSDFKTPVHMPGQEYVAGLHASTWPGGVSDKPPRYFRTQDEVKAAYARGEIDANDRVVVMHG